MSKYTEAAEVVLAHTDEQDLLRLNKALVRRLRELRRQKASTMAAPLKIGDPVIIRGIKPRYLDGVRGTITAIPTTFRGKPRAEIKLTSYHVKVVRTKGGYVNEEGVLSGIPMACLTVEE